MNTQLQNTRTGAFIVPRQDVIFVDGAIVDGEHIDLELEPDNVETPLYTMWVKGFRPADAEYTRDDTYVLRCIDGDLDMPRIGCDWAKALAMFPYCRSLHPVMFQIRAGERVVCDVVVNGQHMLRLTIGTVLYRGAH